MPHGDLIIPGLTLCGRCRARNAVLAWSDPEALTRRAAEPELLCFECLELELERERARAISPHAAAMQDLAHGRLERPFVLDAKTEAMIERLSTPSSVRLARRCRAVLPDGRRCGRDATVPGRYADSPQVCETCANAGRPVPGLGWTADGAPRGGLVTFRRP